MKKLDYFIKKDPRIKKIYDYAKKKYNKANLVQHNWEHILRDLYRALIIAETEKNVNYSVLIPAILLHDLGVTEDVYQHHTEKGSMIIKRDLPKLGYEKEEIEQIAYCVVCHKGKPKPNTTESKILFDADRLEKSGIGGIFTTYRAQLELKKSLNKWAFPRFYKNKDLFTKKAKEISGKGFSEWDKHFKEVKKSLKKRKDFLVKEKDLWK